MSQSSNSIKDEGLDVKNTFQIRSYKQVWLISDISVMRHKFQKECFVQTDKYTRWKFELSKDLDDAKFLITLNGKLITSAQEPLTAQLEASIVSHGSASERRVVAVEYNFRHGHSQTITLIDWPTSSNCRDPLAEGNGYVLSNQLIILIVIKVSSLILIDERISLSAVFSDRAIPGTVDESIKHLLMHDASKDLLIRCNGHREFKAHKTILIARSEVFRRMFSSDMKEARENIIEITDIEPDVVEELISYLYTDRVKFESQEKLMELLVAADKYQLDHLKILCQSSLLKSISVESCWDLVMFGQLHHLDMFRHAALFGVSHAEQVIETDAWKRVFKERGAKAEERAQRYLKIAPKSAQPEE